MSMKLYDNLSQIRRKADRSLVIAYCAAAGVTSFCLGLSAYLEGARFTVIIALIFLLYSLLDLVVSLNPNQNKE